MLELRQEAAALEAGGKKRVEIARQLGLTPAQVTNWLGAKRRYGYRRA